MTGPMLIEQDTLPEAGIILDRHLALVDDGPPEDGAALTALCGVRLTVGPPPAEVLPGVPAAYTADCPFCQDVLTATLLDTQAEDLDRTPADSSAAGESHRSAGTAPPLMAVRLSPGEPVHLCRLPLAGPTLTASCGAALPRTMVEIVDPGDGVPCTCCLLTSSGSDALLECHRAEDREFDAAPARPSLLVPGRLCDD
ncbi:MULTISPECIES: hypothetical protein [Actinoalloteichus]|uniref:Uncharacterized protein n=1 Tax=Actinoalloteichus fjordicus TaxID=1612552 RepID=A0AAC9LH68_9PSEU|nr:MULTISPECIES: hypothetical protein [Actinoalloteichus]APU17728.1 hypothetical protein UA74_28645 [Actinoalloteichus fjordicus]APU23806.1 hypothetical protein UA75_29175 [Actinoalloteichus sp. GBA129-24]